MAHYARLNDNNIVEQVIVISDSAEMVDGVFNEQAGIDFCSKLTGHKNWIKTSYNNNIRKRFAGIGFSYDPIEDVFIPVKPYFSWVLNSDFLWEAPTPRPNDGKKYKWNEESLSWVEIATQA
jgi:hypothetical protein